VTEVQRSLSAAKALLVVEATIDPAVEAAWNQWYDATHLPAILACPHFEAGARYVNEEQSSRRYLTVYRLSSTEAIGTPEFARARGWAQFKDRVHASTRLYRLAGEAKQ
jgi:hypothetical protein